MNNKLVTAVLCFGSHICNQAARIRVKRRNIELVQFIFRWGKMDIVTMCPRLMGPRTKLMGYCVPCVIWLLDDISLMYPTLGPHQVCPASTGCNVSPSPTDVSPTENSWMLHPLDKVSLDYFPPDRTIPSLNSDLIGVLCVGRACIRRRGANQ